MAAEGLATLPVDGRRVIVLVPDGTRTMPLPLMVDILERELGPRVAALDFLVALGTHSPMSDKQLTTLLGRRCRPDVPAATACSTTSGTTRRRSSISGASRRPRSPI